MKKKKILKSYWSTNSVIKTPLFTETMSRDHYLTILRYLHFVNNDNAPKPDDVNRDKLSVENKTISGKLIAMLHCCVCTIAEFILG